MISTCPVSYGKMNKKKSPVELLKWVKSIAVSKTGWEKLSEEDREEKIVIGEFTDTNKMEYTEKYKMVMKKAQEAGGNKK